MHKDMGLKKLDEETLGGVDLTLEREHEALTNMVATIRDNFIDVNKISSYVGYDITPEIAGYPTLALYYIGVYLKIVEEEGENVY